MTKLEPHVEHDEDGNITSKRQVEGTLVSQIGCEWGVRVSWKDVGKRGSSNKAFVITVTSLDYKGHPLVDNPLSILLSPRAKPILVSGIQVEPFITIINIYHIYHKRQLSQIPS